MNYQNIENFKLQGLTETITMSLPFCRKTVQNK